MTQRNDLLASIAGTISDYRGGELQRPTPEHVERWICQFDVDVDTQDSILREMDHVLKRTYFSRSAVRDYFAGEIINPQLAGDDPCAFWKTAHLLNIQRDGSSQVEIRTLFAEELKKQCGVTADECGANDGPFVYLDDGLFSGSRVGNDLTVWIANESPPVATVYVVVITAHRLGRYQCSQRLKRDAVSAQKQIDFRFWADRWIENRKTYRNKSEVLWPTAIPEDPALTEYLAQETRFPFEPRVPGGQVQHAIFSSENGRQLLEREMLLAGMRIRSFSQTPHPALRPLGFSPFGLGFGSMIVTYRNCPNNAPLAFWWGDPEANPNHPFSRWYPLVQRKTYAGQ